MILAVRVRLIAVTVPMTALRVQIIAGHGTENRNAGTDDPRSP